MQDDGSAVCWEEDMAITTRLGAPLQTPARDADPGWNNWGASGRIGAGQWSMALLVQAVGAEWRSIPAQASPNCCLLLHPAPCTTGRALVSRKKKLGSGYLGAGEHMLGNSCV